MYSHPLLGSLPDDSTALVQGLEAWLAGGAPFDTQSWMGKPTLGDMERTMQRFVQRRTLSQSYGFGMPGVGFVARVGRFGPIVEIGAGTGFLSALLTAHGVSSIATDPHPVATNRYGFAPAQAWPVEAIDAATAIAQHPDRAVLCSWPCYEAPWAGEAIAQMRPGQVLFLIGEGWGGCTGDEGLFARLQAEFTEITEDADATAVARWPGLHDHLSVWRRNSPPLLAA